jgi:hypothetical protein
MKTRTEKLAFISKIREGTITKNELFFASMEWDKCTADELEWLLDMKRKLNRGESPTQEDKQYFERFKRNYNARNKKPAAKD